MEQKIKDRIEIDDNGCWVWQRQIHKNGYAKWKIGNPQKTVWMHRFSWEVFNSKKIPDGLTIDHLCGVRACINPKHLEPVTAKENYDRYNAGYQKTNPNFICGHPKDGETLNYWNGKRYQRRCKQCYKQYMKEYYATTNRIH